MGWKLHEGKYLHGEAFCLMLYANEDRTVTETLWNSRDGVTPFILHSVDGVEMSHVDWQKDYREPGHIPKVGTRMFVDLTKEKMLEYKRTLVEDMWEHDGEYAMKDNPELGKLGKEGAALRLAYSEWQDGQPDVVVVTEEILFKLERKRARDHAAKLRETSPRAG